MKKLMALFLFVALLTPGVALAETTSTDHLSTKVCGKTIAYDHAHEYTDSTTEGFGAGIGADVVVYQGPHPLFQEVVIENRYDIDNDEYRVFGVARVNLFEYLANR